MLGLTVPDKLLARADEVIDRGAQPHTSRERPPTDAAYCCEPKLSSAKQKWC
jgi:hypothetical protein